MIEQQIVCRKNGRGT